VGEGRGCRQQGRRQGGSWNCPDLLPSCRCGRGYPSPGADVGRGEPSPGADVAGAIPVPVQMWQGLSQSWCRCGSGEPSPGADVAGAIPVPVQMWLGRAQSWCRCGRGKPSPGADVARASPVPVQMWLGQAQSRCRCDRWERDHYVPLFTCGRGGSTTTLWARRPSHLQSLPNRSYRRVAEIGGTRTAQLAQLLFGA
jgi:hypothetical protein